MTQTKRVQQRQETAQKYNLKTVQFDESFTGLKGEERTASLQAQYKALAKRADTRLKRLEKLSKQEYFQGVETYSYTRAKYDIRSMFGEKAQNFERVIKGNDRQIIAGINNILTFLNSPTSTKSGIVKIYKKRAETFSSKHGNVSWQTMANFYEKGYNEKFSSKLSSGTMIKLMSKVETNKDDISKFLKEKIGENIHIPTNNEDIVRYIGNKLKDNKIDQTDILLYLNGKD